MPKRSRTGKPDVNQMAANLIDAITGELPAEQPDPSKNPNAVALGRLGGLKGGRARADKLSAKKRKDIARKAARSRWARPGPARPERPRRDAIAAASRRLSTNPHPPPSTPAAAP